ncbi:MAG: hypothetical protein ABL903_17405 [Methylococcales bacterium]
MNLISLVIFLGLFLLYFLDAAFKLSLLDIELLIHSTIRFFMGFFLMGIGVFYAHTLRFQNAVYLAIALVLADDIWDYVRHVDSFKPEIMLHSIYLLLWGSITGYVVMRHLANRNNSVD